MSTMRHDKYCDEHAHAIKKDSITPWEKLILQ